MVRKLLSALLLFSVAVGTYATEWKGKFLILEHSQSCPNTWALWRKNFNVDKVPSSVKARIATDTKYWLYINERLVVFEGGLKRGPEPNATYYDEVEIAPYLQEGDNLIAVLTWHFGLNGFSHVNSGTSGLLFEAEGDGVQVVSDKTWRGALYGAYGETDAPKPNYRISESNIRFDGRKEEKGWYTRAYTYGLEEVLPVDVENCPLGKLVKRPIPLFKDSGLLDFKSKEMKGDTLVCTLPYNCQCTPYIKLRSQKAGQLVKIQTDVHMIGGSPTVRCEYITREGEQEYENMGWFNGHQIWYILPEGVEVLDVKYRESGYGCDMVEPFHCDDPFFNELWIRAQRTLYITMRDNYMDCPDRERGQWWGDAVNELGETYYALTPDGNKLGMKALNELFCWQRGDGVLYSPVPAGNWNKELPSQILATTGWYGIYMQCYYANDFSVARRHYDRLHRYLHEVWKTDANGLAILRQGDWFWGDWGENIDQLLLQNAWYYLALKGELELARLFGKSDDVQTIQTMMKRMEDNFDHRFWTGSSYRSPDYKGESDDRGNALAVVSGLASKDKYPALKTLLTTEYHASPYMEKYVLEALFCMDATDEALDRIRKRYKTMVEYPGLTTLPENWIDETIQLKPGEPMINAFWGTYNHGWSGGPLTLLSQKVCGIEPTSPGFRTFRIRPQMGYLKQASCHVSSVSGEISVNIQRKGKKLQIDVTVPSGTTAEVVFPSGKTKTLQSGTHSIRG